MVWPRLRRDRTHTGRSRIDVSVCVCRLPVKVDVSSETSGSQDMCEVVIIAASLGIVLGMISETDLMVYSLRGYSEVSLQFAQPYYYGGP